jgi:glycosyltransferase involved in cell wall biosynthesis
MDRLPEPFEVSVVIPSHDALPLVLAAIDSVLAQTLPPAEIVVVDDNSTDGTAEAIAERFARHPEVRVVRGRFGGAAAARNAGWREASRPWIAFLDADDIWFPDKLAAAAEALGAFPMAGWFFSDGTFRPVDGEEWRSWLSAYAEVESPYVGSPLAQLMEVNFVLTTSVVVRRDLLEALGGFDASMSHAEDIDLWIRLAKRVPATAVARPLVRYQHQASGLTRQVERRLKGDIDLFRRLSRDRELPGGLRRRARRREALAWFKLAFGALRDGDRWRTWSLLPRAWMFPERALPVSLLAVASLLPGALLRRLAKRRVGAHAAAQKAFSLSRVALRSDRALLDAASRGVS